MTKLYKIFSEPFLFILFGCIGCHFLHLVKPISYMCPMSYKKSLRLKLLGLQGVESRQHIRFLGMRRTPLKIPRHTIYREGVIDGYIICWWWL